MILSLTDDCHQKVEILRPIKILSHVLRYAIRRKNAKSSHAESVYLNAVGVLHQFMMISLNLTQRLAEI